MKRIAFLSIFILSVFAFNNCSDQISGTEFINYISFESKSAELIVNKNSTANREIKVYTTQKIGSDRTFTVTVDASTTADPASYDVPATVTVPANTNVGSFTISISDVNISPAGVKLVLGIQSQEGLFTGSKITINMKSFCPFVIDDFLGDYIISEAGYGDYPTTITKDPSVENRIWITNFWDWTNDLAYYDFDPASGTVTMPDQYITMGDGNEYLCTGTGTFNACNGTFHVEYEGDVAGTVHDFNPL